jgi:hypothetical protein
VCRGKDVRQRGRGDAEQQESWRAENGARASVSCIVTVGYIYINCKHVDAYYEQQQT